jgi:hypothetical protein
MQEVEHLLGIEARQRIHWGAALFRDATTYHDLAPAGAVRNITVDIRVIGPMRACRIGSVGPIAPL